MSIHLAELNLINSLSFADYVLQIQFLAAQGLKRYIKIFAC